MEPKLYLDYLDKEMTIMGILCAFSVAAPGGILVAVMGKEGQVAAALWSSAQLFFIAGSFFCVLAASMFYKERSKLAWFYGQISLVQAYGGRYSELRTWFRDADAWDTWWPYCCGFTFLITGFVEYFLAVTIYAVPSHWFWLATHLHGVKTFTFAVCPLVSILACVLQCFVRIRFKYEDRAWAEFWRTLIGKRSQ